MVESVPSNKFLFCCGVVNGYFIFAKMTKDGSSPSMVGPSKLSIRVCSQQSLFVFGGVQHGYFYVKKPRPCWFVPRSSFSGEGYGYFF